VHQVSIFGTNNKVYILLTPKKTISKNTIVVDYLSCAGMLRVCFVFYIHFSLIIVVCLVSPMKFKTVELLIHAITVV